MRGPRERHFGRTVKMKSLWPQIFEIIQQLIHNCSESIQSYMSELLNRLLKYELLPQNESDRYARS